jgi:hypothetical protein
MTLAFKNYSFGIFDRWNKKVTQIYCTQWIILGILDYIVKFEPLDLWSVLLVTSIVLLHFDLIMALYLKLKINYSGNKQELKIHL